MVKYSIIIPTYNCEKFIEKCVMSLLKQPFFDFEIVIVDDCSIDKTLSICKKIARQNKKLKIFKNNKNRGVSFSRNLGIEKSNGKYILFVDADDYVSPNYFETLEKYPLNEFDAFSFGFYEIVFDSDSLIVEKRSVMNVDTSEEDNLKWEKCFKYSFFGSVWNKVYNSQKVKANNIRFKEGFVCYEDYIFNLNYFSKCEKIKFISTPLYYYRIFTNVDPVIKRKWGKRFEISNYVYNQVIVFLNNNEHIDSRLVVPYAFSCFIAELKYAMIKKTNYNQALYEACKSKNFYNVIRLMNPKGKRIILLYVFLKLRILFMAKVVLKGIVKCH